MTPAYDFQCPSCSGVIEVTRAMSDNTPGPTCGDCLVEMTKKFHANPAIFNSPGFYKTDNR